MSILIKGMDMPKYCCDCLFCENHVYCRLLKIDLWHHAIWSERHLLCPLVEVPNHDEIDAMPKADVVEVVHGKNISKGGFLCSVCSFGDFGGFHGYEPNFCPNCGADMRLKGGT